MTIYVPISIAANIIGVCSKTLRRWDQSGIFSASFRTPGKHRRYDLLIVKSFKDRNIINQSDTCTPVIPKLAIRVALYSRVSSSKQKKRGDLDRQEQQLQHFCIKNNLKVVNSFKDVGSGLNDSRVGLRRLIKFVSTGSCDQVLVSYSDRLARFGTNSLKLCFSAFGVNLKFLGGTSGGLINSKEGELVNDITSILYSYMGKLYRMRRGKNISEDT